MDQNVPFVAGVAHFEGTDSRPVEVFTDHDERYVFGPPDGNGLRLMKQIAPQKAVFPPTRVKITRFDQFSRGIDAAEVSAIQVNRPLIVLLKDRPGAYGESFGVVKQIIPGNGEPS